ncbi:mannose-6-phosphate isomerase, class I [Arthrobacter sp. UM1]|uniref:mannose-6-phosphate isomerase, class I n=1 Tax=Arthrobacter sp. UM1 TaxID=2766776 RepID=UPI00299EBB98|nr:mannose-6-phosphate isomerase, class I [Arthrobacter sp. UM1]MCB4207962.1 mannose-6-phosphate isomerase, class I [Arthrobacter sp. UM1]
MKLLHNSVRDYAWGSPTAIPELTGTEPDGRPQAEMWIGAHPAAPSVVEHEGERIPLDELIARDPERVLGAPTAQRFGALPFLAKLLAADHPLSLQVHPSIEQAEAGFSAEEAAGVPLDAPHRNYKDRNHKPEMVVALTRFEALSGFRDPAETARLLSAVRGVLPEGSAGARVLADLERDLGNDDAGAALRAAFTRALTGNDSSEAVGDVAAALSRAELGEGPVAAWRDEAATFLLLAEEYPGDPGALVALLANRVTLEPGEALYLPAGNLHAYLKGFGVEVMAASDNVLRGGLTPKHVDLDELSTTVRFEPLPVPRCVPEAEEFAAGTRELFLPPFDEFSVERIAFAVDGSAPARTEGAAVVIVTEGSATVAGARLSRGQSAFLEASESAPAIAATAGSVVFVVTGARAAARDRP